MNVTMEVDKTFASLGEPLGYTVKVKNDSEDILNHMTMSQMLPIDTIIRCDYIEVEGKPYPLEALEFLEVEQLFPGEEKHVYFELVVDSLPFQYILPLTYDVSYKVNDAQFFAQSNTVVTVINDPYLIPQSGGLIVRVSPQNFTDKSQINYDVWIGNKGNVEAQEVVLHDWIPEGMHYIIYSLYIDEKPYGEIENGSTLRLGNLEPGQKRHLTYKVGINQCLNFSLIDHQMMLSMVFTLQNRKKVYKESYFEPVGLQLTMPSFSPLCKGYMRYVSKTICQIGDELLYTLYFKNIGNKKASHVQLFEYIPEALDTSHQPFLDAPIELGDISPGEEKQVEYTAYVKDPLEIPDCLITTGVLCYEYDYKGEALKEEVTLTQEIELYEGSLKNSYLHYPYNQEVLELPIGETFSGELVLVHTGNTQVICEYLEWILPSGIRIKTPLDIEKEVLKPLESKCFLVDFEVVSLSLEESIEIGAQISYTHRVGAETALKTDRWFNTTPLKLIGSVLIAEGMYLVDGESFEYAEIGSYITYHLQLKNLGNQSARNIHIEPAIVEGLEFLDEPYIVLDLLEPGSEQTIVLTAVVKEIPKTINGQAEVQIQYHFEDSNLVQYTRTIHYVWEGPSVLMPYITSGDYEVINTVSQSMAQIGDQLVYTFYLYNVGNRAAHNIKIQERFNPSICAFEKELLPGAFKVLSYTLEVTSRPKNDCICSQTQITYTYEVGKHTKEKQMILDPIKTHVYDAQITDQPYVPLKWSHLYSTVGDTLYYTLELYNGGNVAAENITFQPTLIDGCIWGEGIEKQERLEVGAFKKYQFKLYVQSMPSNEQIYVCFNMSYCFRNQHGEVYSKTLYSESAVTQIRLASLLPETSGYQRSACPSVVSIGDQIFQKICLMNQGNVSAYKVTLEEHLGEGLCYKPNSLMIQKKDEKASVLPRIITFEEIKPHEKVEISYLAQVMSLPENTVCENIGELNYAFEIDPEESMRNSSHIMGKSEIEVYDPDLKEETLYLELKQNVYDIGDLIFCSLVIDFEGNIAINHTLYQLKVDLGLSYVKESLKVNHVAVEGDPIKGIELGERIPCQPIYIEFELKVEQEVTLGANRLQGLLYYSFDTSIQKNISRKLIGKAQMIEMIASGPKTCESCIQTLSPYSGRVGEPLDYILELPNEGNQTMEHIELTFEDLDLEYFRIKGCKRNTIELGNLQGFDTKRIKKSIEVIDIPPNTHIRWNPCISYQYKKKTREDLESKTIALKPLECVIEDPGLYKEDAIALSCNKKHLKYLERFQVTCKLVHSGNIDAQNIEIIPGKSDYFDIDTEVLEDLKESLLIQGQTKSYSFEAKVIDLPLDGKADLDCKVRYTYENSIEGIQMCEVDLSPIQLEIWDVLFEQESVSLTTYKKTYLEGDVIEGEILCHNKGNQIATKAVIEFDLPKELVLEAAEENKITLGHIEGQEKITRPFKIRIDQLLENPLFFLKATLTCAEILPIPIEPVPIEITGASLVYTFEPHKRWVAVGEIIEFTLIIENKGYIEAADIVVSHLWPKGIKGKQDVFKLESLKAGDKYAQTFKGWVKEKPVIEQSKHKVNLVYTQFLEDRKYEKAMTYEMETVEIEDPLLVMSQKSDCDHKKLEVGDIVHYLIKCTNQGSLNLENIRFFAQMPEGSLLINNKIYCQDEHFSGRYLEEGIQIGKLAVGESLHISYSVKVHRYISGELTHKIWCRYDFKKGDEQELYTKQSEYNWHSLKLISPNKMKATYTLESVLPVHMADINKVVSAQISHDDLMLLDYKPLEKSVCIRGQTTLFIIYEKENHQEVHYTIRKVYVKEMELIKEYESVNDIVIDVKEHVRHIEVINPRQIRGEIEIVLTEE